MAHRALGDWGEEQARWCHTCGGWTKHRSEMLSMGCLISLLTCGLGLPIALLLYLVTNHWKCERCGMAN